MYFTCFEILCICENIRAHVFSVPFETDIFIFFDHQWPGLAIALDIKTVRKAGLLRHRGSQGYCSCILTVHYKVINHNHNHNHYPAPRNSQVPVSLVQWQVHLHLELNKRSPPERLAHLPFCHLGSQTWTYNSLKMGWNLVSISQIWP